MSGLSNAYILQNPFSAARDLVSSDTGILLFVLKLPLNGSSKLHVKQNCVHKFYSGNLISNNKEVVPFLPKNQFMKRIILTICTILLLTTINNVNGQTAEEMKAWQDFMTPGAMHQWLAKFNGTWDVEITSYMDPANPSKSTGTAVYTSIMNGLYQVGDMTSTMMGMPFQGHSVSGYDNGKKLFVSTWVDNFGSGIILMTGTYDEATKTLNLKGTQTDPLTGKDSWIREEMKIVNDDTYNLLMYGPGPDGKEMMFMSGVFKRKK